MTEITIKAERVYQSMSREREDFSFMQRLALRLSYPSAIFIEIVGLIWSAYYLWNVNWRLALAIFTGSMVLARIAASEKDYVRLSQTTLGKIALLHLHPLNFILGLLGFAALGTSVWIRSLVLSLIGISLLLLGHYFGWARVNPDFGRANR